MTNSLYISTTEPRSGQALIALGIIEQILKKTTKIGFFRPLIQDSKLGEKDRDIDLILTHFSLKQTYEESFGLLRQEANFLASQQKYDELLEIIITKYNILAKKCDFILCEGSDYLGEETAFEFDFNTDIAKNLGCTILILGNAYQNSLEDALTPIQMAFDTYQSQDCQVIGIIINKVNPELVDELKTTLEKRYNLANYLLAVIPENKKLSSPRIGEIAEQLEAEILWGNNHLNNLVSDYVIAAMQMQHALNWFTEENSLVITSGDRGDIVIGAIQAHQSTNYPNLAGILLTGGFQPEDSILRLIQGLPVSLPILSVKTDTYHTISQLNQVNVSLQANDQDKIDLSIQLFKENVDVNKLEEKIRTIQVEGITPRMFIYNLVQQATSQKKHIVLPEGNEPRILRATAALLAQKIVDITLLGKRDEIQQIIKKHSILLDINQLNIINPADSEKLEEYTQTFYELRKHKGITLDAAKDCIIDISYFGTMMVYQGDADGMVSGSIHTTQHTIRPALQIIKTKPGFSLISSVFFMCLDDRVLVYGDCAINSHPTPEELAEIALTSAETAQAFGIEPKVALLSYSSGDSGKGEEVEKVRKATKIAQEKRPDLKLEGPIQYDAAVNREVAAQKMPNSQVAGQANVFIFPDLNTGNNTYKAVQRETGAIAIGPILQGLKKPVNDLSRGCTIEDIINTVVITAIQAQKGC